MTTRALLACLLTLLALAADRTNVLTICADDIGNGDRSPHGGKIIPASNVDALLAAGVRCISNYVISRN